LVCGEQGLVGWQNKSTASFEACLVVLFVREGIPYSEKMPDGVRKGVISKASVAREATYEY